MGESISIPLTIKQWDIETVDAVITLSAYVPMHSRIKDVEYYRGGKYHTLADDRGWLPVTNYTPSVSEVNVKRKPNSVSDADISGVVVGTVLVLSVVAIYVLAK